MKQDKVYYDVCLHEVAYWYMRKKHIAQTTGNLFILMEKILQRAEKSGNRFRKAKTKFKFINNHCEVAEDFISPSIRSDAII